MDKSHYDELILNIEKLIAENIFVNNKIYIFGHCNASESLIDYLIKKKIDVEAILDNNTSKIGKKYRKVQIVSPEKILCESGKNTVVLIAARAHSSMIRQLNNMNYKGIIYKVVDYNSFSEYSLSESTVLRMQARLESGLKKLDDLKKIYGDVFKIFCPFQALGDIYIMMSFLPYFLKKRCVQKYVVFVVGNACKQVVKLFGDIDVESLSQRDMDEILQAVIYTQESDNYIAHQDRPYVVNLHKALYGKCIPIETIYCCGVFGLPKETVPIEATIFTKYSYLDSIPEGKAVILSPYAKSVTTLPLQVWQQIVEHYNRKGYKCFTNIVGDEIPLENTVVISPKISEMKSVVEHAGTFIGIRSGLCDVIRSVRARKIALYPDYNYSDTKWKSKDIYFLSGWENYFIKEDENYDNG